MQLGKHVASGCSPGDGQHLIQFPGGTAITTRRQDGAQDIVDGMTAIALFTQTHIR